MRNGRSSDDPEDLFNLNTTNSGNKNVPSARVTICKHNTEFMIDSGAGKTVIDEFNYQKLGR